MKLQIVSDLHLEFSMIDLPKEGDILILAGDIMIANYFTRGDNSPLKAIATRWLAWMENTCAKFDKVIYILGNHEHYKGKFYETYDILVKAFSHITNLHILDQTWVDIDEFRFIGGTLWTDFGNDNLAAMFVRDGLNDYKVIEGNDYRKLTTAETAFYNKQFLNAIAAQDPSNLIVIGHHSPSYNSVAEKYRYGMWSSLNAGYASHLDNFILDNPVKLWIHGHTHDSYDYTIGDTRVVCNPRGYQTTQLSPENTLFNPTFTVEI